MSLLQVLLLRALMHVIAGGPEIVNIGKPSILNSFRFSEKPTCAYQQPVPQHG